LRSPWPRRQIDPRRRPTRACLPLQHAQQLHQSCGSQTRARFRSDAAGRATARPLLAPPSCTGRPADSFTSTQRFPAPGRLASAASDSGQRGQAKPLLLAEINPAQPAGFVFGHQLPGFRATPAAPNFYNRYLLVPSTASRTAAREQMGCSNAYSRTSGILALLHEAIDPCTGNTQVRVQRDAFDVALFRCADFCVPSRP